MKDRTVALYRVSKKQQTGSNENDLPIQRKLVQDYIYDHNLNLVREFTEGGVSGYKNLSSEREAILSILEMAQNQEFDILVVYHSNRLSRLQDDTLLIIKQLNEYNVLTTMTVYSRWSTKDGAKHKTGDYRYRCGSFYKRGGIKCEGQSTYSRAKLDTAVLNEVNAYVAELKDRVLEKRFFIDLDKKIDFLKKRASQFKIV